MAATVKVAKPGSSRVKVNGVIPLESEAPEVQQHAYIPHPDYALKYVHRKINGVEDFALLDWCLKTRSNLLLRGDTGGGKTMFPMAYAADRCIPFYSVPCDVSIDPRALFGKMMPTDRVGEFKWVDGPVTEMVRNGGILSFAEVNFMPAKIAAALYQLTDHRRSLTLLEHEGETITAHRDLLITADMNPKYRGTVDLNIAFANRFPIKVNWGYNEEVEDTLVKSSELLDMVRKIRKVTEIRTPIGTNSMLEFINVSCDLGFDFASQNFVNMFSDSERDTVSKLMDAASVNIKRDIDVILQGRNPYDDIKDAPEDDAWFTSQGVNPDDFEWEPEGS